MEAWSCKKSRDSVAAIISVTCGRWAGNNDGREARDRSINHGGLPERVGGKDLPRSRTWCLRGTFKYEVLQVGEELPEALSGLYGNGPLVIIGRVKWAKLPVFDSTSGTIERVC